MDICIALTVFFDGQFYVGLLERRNRGEMNAARVVFGAEPGDAELLDWIISGYPGAVFSPARVCAARGQAGGQSQAAAAAGDARA